MYLEKLDHHSENYTGLEGLYDGMDPNDYEVEQSLKNIED